MFFTGQCAWGCEDVRVDNCLVQLDNNGNWGDAAVISGYTNGGMYKGSASSWNGAIRNLTIKNSTFYNIKDNAKNRFIRYTNSVRSGLNAIFDTASGSATFSNNTFVKTMSDKEFGNATPNNSSFEINFDGNILCISARISKFIQGNCKVNALFCFTARFNVYIPE